MSYTLMQLQEIIEDNNIKFVRLAFCDIFGMPKNIAIMASGLKHAVEKGVSFDASAIAGFANVAESDLFLFPDLDTFALLPWRPTEGCVCRFFCDIKYPDGRPFEGDCRHLLADVATDAKTEGYSFLMGPECEFYLFETSEQGWPTQRPFDDAGYLDIAPLDRGENVRREICLTLEEMGIQPERSHHEQGPGQNEIDFRCSSPLRAADNLMALRTVVKAVAARNGLFASFLPKPLQGESGSGLHINISVFQNGKNLFEHFGQDNNPIAAAFLAGVLRRMPELTLFCNPLPGSYKRLGHFEAPRVISWSCQNRSSLIRVPAATGNDCRMELRSPDPACNPYLVTALVLAAGFEGVKKALPLPAPTNFDVNHTPLPADLTALPKTLNEALAIAEKSTFLPQHMGEKLLKNYLASKKAEAAAYDAESDPYRYEMQQYFNQM